MEDKKIKKKELLEKIKVLKKISKRQINLIV